jgi:hypothetical protein
MYKKRFLKQVSGMFDWKGRQVLASAVAIATLVTGLVAPLGAVQAAQASTAAATSNSFVSDPSDPASKGLSQTTPMKLPPSVTALKGQSVTPDRMVSNKKLPPASRTSSSTPMSALSGCPPSSCYYYNVGSQGFTTTLPTGTFANFSAISPTLDTAHDYHSLVENAVEKTVGGHLQIVEAGVTVDQLVNGNTTPRFFVYHWVNDNGTCYNGCGWVDNSAVTTNVGDAISANKSIGIQHYASGSGVSPGWWVWISAANAVCNAGDNTCGWAGYFPDSLWTSASPSVTTFTNEDYTQVFGEISANETVASTVCTDMGTSTLATTTAGASIGSTQYIGLSTSAVNLYDRESPSGIDPYWNVVELGTPGNIRTFRYGGPGGC